MSRPKNILTLALILIIGFGSAALVVYTDGDILSILPSKIKRGTPSDEVQTFTSAEALPPADAQNYLTARLDDRLYADIVAFYNGVQSFQEKITLPYPVSDEQSSLLFSLLIYDYPEVIHLSSNYTTWSNEYDGVTAISPQYTMTKEERDSAIKQMENLVDGWAKEVGSKSELEKEKFVYDRLYEGCVYELNTPNCGTAYGCLIEGKARCEGYAKAAVYALRRLGVDCLAIVGRANDPDNNDDILHAWNAVKIDGQYYLLDPTWDGRTAESEAGEKCKYFYFNLDGEVFNRNHSPLEEFQSLGLPECNSNKYNYQVLSDSYVENTDDGEKFLHEKLTEIYQNGGSSLNLRFESQETYTFVKENLSEIIEDWLNENYIFGAYHYLATHADSVYCLNIEINFS